MKMPNYDVEDKQSSYKQKVSVMPDRCLRMLACRLSGSRKIKFADLSPDKGNFHSYNNKVIFTTMIKISQGD